MPQPNGSTAPSPLNPEIPQTRLIEFKLNPLEPPRRFRRQRFLYTQYGRAVAIRRATLQDAGAIWQVLQAAVTPLAGHTYTPAQIAAWIADEAPENFAKSLALGRTVLVAESDKRVIGFSRFSRVEIEALYVHPDQSRRHVGELMLATVETSALAGKVRTLQLDAVMNAIPFYESAGYEVLGPSLPLFDDGTALPCLRMGKTLTGRGTVPRLSRISPSPLRFPGQPRPDRWPSRAKCYRASLD